MTETLFKELFIVLQNHAKWKNLGFNFTYFLRNNF